VANPVQAISSKTAATSPTTRPVTSRLALSSVVKMPGLKASEVSASALWIAVHKTGAVSSATAYQRTPTRHRSNRDRRSRSPALP
jgi:hypothetical protein